MIDVYAIGVTLKLNDFIGPQMFKLAEQFEKMDLLAVSLNKTLKSLGSNASGLKALNVETGGLDKKLERVNAQAILLERNLRGLKATGSLPGIGGTVPGGVIPPGRPGGGSGGGNRNGHRSGLHGGNIHMGAGGMGIGSVGMGLGANAMVPLAVGGAALYIGHQFYEAAKDYDMAFNRFKTLNLGSKINDDANAFARGTTQFGVSMKDRMTILRDMHEVMGSYEEAKAVTPLFSRMLAANVGVFGEDGNRFDTKTFQALGKVIEMRGGTNSPDEMFKQADFAQRTLTGSAGLVGPSDLLAFMKTGGVATRLLSNKAFYEQSAPMIQEMGGSRFGTSLMSAHQNLAMGRGSLKSMKEAARLGIIDPSMIEYTKIGTIKQVLPGALKDDGLYNTSKFEWLMQDLIPAIKAKGVRGKDGMVTGDKITDDQIVNELNTIFSQRTAGNAFAQMYLQRHKIDKNVGVTEGAMGINELEELNKKSASGAELEFSKAWRDFKTEFGKNVLPAVTDIINDGSMLFRNLTAFKEHYFPSGPDSEKSAPSHDRALLPAWMVGDKAPKSLPTVASPAASAPAVTPGTVYLDGQKVGFITGKYIGKEMNKPPVGPNFFDASMGLRPVGGR